jgi:tRNA threonylcarbamoyladenosine biosynthesis protein TsaE
MTVRRERSVVRHDAGRDVELDQAWGLALLDERSGLGDRSERGERGHGRLRGVPPANEPALDDERAVGFDPRVQERQLLDTGDVREQVSLGVLSDPQRRVHPGEQGAGLGQQPPGVTDALSSLVDVPARPHDGQTNGMEIESSSPDETEAAGAQLAEELERGDVVTVSGELGTGKTTFVRGACRWLGVEGPVTSPTYTIGHRYAGRVPVSHLDLYRFAGVSDAEWGDLEPYFSDAVCFVEWPEAGDNVLPPPRFAVSLEHAGEHERRIRVTEC